MTISRKAWEKYITTLRDINEEAAEKLVKYLNTHDVFSGTVDSITLNSDELKPFIDYAYAIVSKYGEASASLAAEMYDLTAELEGVFLPPAELAPLAKYGDVAKAINGTIKTSQNYDEIASAATRWVKMAASDTTLHNAQRDHAQFAWIPHSETCAFCLTLASRGWQYMSKNAMKGGHAEHIHSNCDCQYTIRHDPSMTVEGYDPDEYLRMYRNAEGSTPQERINSMRREQYEQTHESTNGVNRTSNAGRNILASFNGGGTIRYEEDVLIPGNVGAKFKDTLIELPDGSESRLTPHTRIEQVQTIAGYGRERQIDQVDNLVYLHQETADSPELWKKQKGFGYVDYMGESFKAELHWYNHPLTGNVDYKIKPDAGGNWFYED